MLGVLLYSFHKFYSIANDSYLEVLAQRVAEETARACGAVTDYFKRYISQSYSRAMQQAGGMVGSCFVIYCTSYNYVIFKVARLDFLGWIPPKFEH